MLLADRGYDADWIRELAMKKGAWANIPPKSNRSEPICFSPSRYRARNRVERFFNKIKQCRRVATRYDKLAANYLAFVQLASIRLWLRANALIDRIHALTDGASTPSSSRRVGLPDGALVQRYQSSAKSPTDDGFSFAMRTCLKQYECICSSIEPPDTRDKCGNYLQRPMYSGRSERLSVRGRFKRQPHIKLCAIRTRAEVDFSVMPFDDDSVGDDESKSRA